MADHRASRRVGHGRSRGTILTTLCSERVRAALSLGILLSLGAVSTSAYWTDQATVTGGTFTTGTLNLKVGDPLVENNPPVFTNDFAMSSLAPGGTKDVVLKVNNAGSLALTYSVGASATNSGGGANQLGSALRITAFPSSSAGACTGTAIQGPVAPGAVSFSRPSLAPSATVELCFRAALPAGAATELQGQSSVVTFTLDAVQVP